MRSSGSRGPCREKGPSHRNLTGLASLVLIFSAAWAQGQTTGSVAGQVSGAGNEPVPQATVVARSLDGRIVRASATNEGGRFQLSSLPVADYVIEASAPGYRSLKQSTRVTVSARLEIHFQLENAEYSETLTIEASPISRSTSFETGFSKELVDELPTNRNFWDLMSVAPGVSSNAVGTTSFSVYGSGIQSNAWLVDGLDISSTSVGGPEWEVNPETIEEVQVLGIGAPAEYGGFLGAALNIVTKSGGESWQGGVQWHHQSSELTTTNVSLAGSPFERVKYEKLAPTLSGPLVENHLWFFAAHEYSRDIFADPGESPEFPSGSIADRSDLKLSFAPTSRHLLRTKVHYGVQSIPLGSPFREPEATPNLDFDSQAWGLLYQGALAPGRLLELSFTGSSSNDELASVLDIQQPALIDYSPPNGDPFRVSGGPDLVYDWQRDRIQGEAKLSAHLGRGASDHHLRLGIKYGESSSEFVSGLGPTGQLFETVEIAPGARLFYRYDQNFYSVGAETDWRAAFVDNAWRPREDLTVDLGARYDRVNSRIPSFAARDRFRAGYRRLSV